VWEYFIRPANEAADMETRMRAEATEKLHDILAPVIKAVVLSSLMGILCFVPARHVG
jgi:hypothetical protein